MDLFTCDVLVVGGGGAGLRAAIAVAETHPRLGVAVISKVYPMRSHTVSAETEPTPSITKTAKMTTVSVRRDGMGSSLP